MCVKILILTLSHIHTVPVVSDVQPLSPLDCDSGSNIIEEPDVIVIDPTETALLHEKVVQVKKEINWDDEESKFHQDPHFNDLNLSLSAEQNVSKIKGDSEDELVSDYDENNSCYDTLESDYEENLTSFVLSPETREVSDQENFFVPSKDTDEAYSTLTTESTTELEYSADIDSSLVSENSHNLDAMAYQGYSILGLTPCQCSLKQTTDVPHPTPNTYKHCSRVAEHSEEDTGNKVDSDKPHRSIVTSNQSSTDIPRDPCPTPIVSRFSNPTEGAGFSRPSIHSGRVARLKSVIVNIQKLPVKAKDKLRTTSPHMHPHETNQPVHVECSQYTLSPYTYPVPNGNGCPCVSCQDLYPPTLTCNCMCSCYSSYPMSDMQYPSCSLCAAQNQPSQWCHCNPSPSYSVGVDTQLVPRASDDKDCHIADGTGTIPNGSDEPLRRMKRLFDEVETESDGRPNNMLYKRHCSQ